MDDCHGTSHYEHSPLPCGVGGALHQADLLELWGKPRVNSITSSSKRVTNEEIIPMAILITNGVGEGSLGMMTVFGHSDQVKVEPSVILPTLVQQDTPELAIVVTKIFINLPCFPQRSFGLPFLDVATLSEGASTTRFSPSRLLLHWLLNYSPTQVGSRGR